MTKGIIMVTIGIFSIFFNTVALIAYNIKMRTENERAFITLRGLREPSTEKLKTKNLNVKFEEPVEDIEAIEVSYRVKSLRFDDTVIIENNEYK